MPSFSNSLKKEGFNFSNSEIIFFSHSLIPSFYDSLKKEGVDFSDSETVSMSVSVLPFASISSSYVYDIC